MLFKMIADEYDGPNDQAASLRKLSRELGWNQPSTGLPPKGGKGKVAGEIRYSDLVNSQGRGLVKMQVMRDPKVALAIYKEDPTLLKKLIEDPKVIGEVASKIAEEMFQQDTSQARGLIKEFGPKTVRDKILGLQ